MNILLLSYIMNACCVRLRYHKMRAHTRTHTHTHIYIYIYIYIYISINHIYLNRKLLNLIVKNYPKQ